MDRPTAPRIGARPSAAIGVAARPTWTPPQAADGTYLLPKACDVFIGEAPSLAPDPDPTKYAHQLHVVVPAGAKVKLVRRSDYPNMTFAPLPTGIEADEPDASSRTFQCNSEDPQNPGYWVVDPVTVHAGKGDGPQINTDGVTLDLNGFSIKADARGETLLVPSPHTGPMDNIGPSMGGARQTLTNSSTTDVSMISGFGHNIDVEADNPTVAGKEISPGLYNIEATGGVGVRLSTGTVTVTGVKSVDFTQEGGVPVGVGFEIRRCGARSTANIHHNHFVGSGEGVLIRECSGVNITDNFISSPGGVGVNTRQAVGTTAAPVRIANNTIDLAYTGQSLVGPTGIAWALASDNLTITGNTIKNYWKHVSDPTEPAESCGIDISSGRTIPDEEWLKANNTIDPQGRQVCGAPANAKPVANFTTMCPELTCTFTSTSTDADGTVASYVWDFGDGSPKRTTATSSVSHTYAAAGTYNATLVVTDNRGGVSAATTKAVTTAVTANNKPTAIFDFMIAGYTANFTDKSTDTDGVVTKWAWTFGDGTTSALQNPSRTYAQSGTYTATLTATDERSGVSTPYTASVKIGPVAISLTARAQTAKGSRRVDLGWSAASGPTVAIYRIAGAPIEGTPLGTPRITTADDGLHTDDAPRGLLSYKVCSTHDNVCSPWMGVNVP
jgi:PKD repeat protein